MRCWGSNLVAQLGDGTTVDRVKPVTVAGVSGATGIVAGILHTCALINDGTVMCWGDSINSKVTTVSGIRGATAIAAGSWHNCALVIGGTVKCWGNDDRGELGDAGKRDGSVVGISGATAIAAGWSSSCAIVGSDVKCWGDNSAGQLGSPLYYYAGSPVVVPGLSGATAVTTGGQTCAVVGGRVLCWRLVPH